MYNIFNNSFFRFMFPSTELTIGSWYVFDYDDEEDSNPFNQRHIIYIRIDAIEGKWCRYTLFSERCGVVSTSSTTIRNIHAFYTKVDCPSFIKP